MTDIEVFSEMISNTAKVSIEAAYRRFKVVLNEPDCPDSCCEIFGIPGEAIVLKVDAFPAPDSVFASLRGECKRADYVIVAEKNGKTVIVYIEMKKTKAPQKDIIKQLLGAHCFIVYCQAIGRAFWHTPNFLIDAEHRYISFGHTGIRKRRTRLSRNSPTHDQPDRLMKIDWPNHVEFNKLVGQV